MPVSSLRSHFESIAHHDHLSQQARRPQPPNPSVQVEPLDRSNRLMTSPSSNQTNLLDSHEPRRDTIDSTRLPARPFTAEIPRTSRPISSYMLVPPHYQSPLATVQSPVPPERANSASNSIPLTSEQRDNAAVGIGHGYAITSPDTAVAPVASHVIKAAVHPHSAFRPGYHTNVSESKTGSGSG